MIPPGKQLFVSTGCYGRKSVAEILEINREYGLAAIELSSGAVYQDNMFNLLKEAYRSGQHYFLVHNYFPPPREPFVLNLASEDKNILKRSRQFCLKSIEMAAELGSPFYSVHSGFCVHANPDDLGKSLTDLIRFSKQEANQNFVDSLKTLADFAADKRIDLLVENNVATSFNLIDGKNEMLLGVTADELTGTFESVNRSNLGLLLDVAHLKVSANALKFDPVGFIRSLAHRIKAIHLSDNDGRRDTNGQITETSWFWPVLLTNLSEDVAWILEAYNLSFEMILKQMSLISSMTNQLHR
jgi:sugar phosphate isomerase/epimerase